MAETSTYKTFLMHGTGSGTITYEKLCDVTEYPDLGTDPELLEVTTLSDKRKRFITGILGNEGMTFKANYDATTYQALKALEGKIEKYAVWYGGTEANGAVTPTGTEGKFAFDGELSVVATGGGVNEVRGMTITIAPSSDIDFSVASA